MEEDIRRLLLEAANLIERLHIQNKNLKKKLASLQAKNSEKGYEKISEEKSEEIDKIAEALSNEESPMKSQFSLNDDLFVPRNELEQYLLSKAR